MARCSRAIHVTWSVCCEKKIKRDLLGGITSFTGWKFLLACAWLPESLFDCGLLAAEDLDFSEISSMVTSLR